MKNQTCCFTGHRKIPLDQLESVTQRLRDAVIASIKDGYDELFMNDAERKENKLPRIYDVPISEIDDFPDHPFKVKVDEDTISKGEDIDSTFERKIEHPYNISRKPKEVDPMRKTLMLITVVLILSLCGCSNAPLTSETSTEVDQTETLSRVNM